MAVQKELSNTLKVDNDQANAKDAVLMQVLVSALDNIHYSPRNLDDKFSEDVYHQYLKQMDFNKRFFLQSDIDQLDKYRLQIDDMIKANNFAFFDESLKILEKRIADSEAYYQEILCQSFDFQQNEDYNFDYEEKPYAADTKALKNEWYKALKYQVLSRVVDKLEQQEKALAENDTTVKVKTLAELESEARDKVLHNYESYYKRLHKNTTEDRFEDYVNAIVSVYDVHTNYFAPKEKEDFDIRMSGQLEGIGATLQEEDGYIKVTSIVPGSPSWKQGDLEVDDVILEVAQGEADPVDIVDMRLDEAVRLIRGPKGTEVRLTVKKPDNSTIKIPIIRDVVILEDTYAKSAVIQKDNKRYGYIYLPRFYADLQNHAGRSCAVDIKNELLKLEKENVAGIVLDLRNNGGGSLEDVVRMTGWFIEKGPVVQVKTPQGIHRDLEDLDPSVVYDGNLVVLVNEFSASASEILAAAIQDYHRGVIMGSKTYGKGSVQRFVELDNFLKSQYNEFKPLGSLKITIQKFYRINGGTTQRRGVEPDISLPDAYTYLETGEAEREFALPWDEIEPVKYATWQNQPDIDALKRMSDARVKVNPAFAFINEQALERKAKDEDKVVSLEMTKFRKEEDENNGLKDKLETMAKDNIHFTVIAPQADAEEMKGDTSKQARFDDFEKLLLKDFYLQEAVNVLEDMGTAQSMK
ncbi:MAG: carboxy terminal-processing peptidase [Bacteroidetes bacterium]|nr:carboxy terminal-processing peptidase [Bacteroidota bacterium]